MQPFTLEAAPICFPRRSVIAASSDIARFTLRANVYGKPDRKSAKEFAKDNHSTADEITKRYAASGDFQCAGKASQAQLVVKNNVILATNHALPGSPCVDEKMLNTCKVTFSQGGKLMEYGIKGMMSTGYKCKKGWVNKSDEDWAILELKDPVNSSLRPYEVKAAPCASNQNPVDVVAVGKSGDYGTPSSQGWTHWTKHFANCQLRKGNCGQRFPAMESDCDASHGTSGGGMFVGGEHPQLIGVVANGNEGCGETNKTGVGEYRESCWSSIYVPVAGELKNQLESLESKRIESPNAPSAPPAKTPSGEPSYQDL